MSWPEVIRDIVVAVVVMIAFLGVALWIFTHVLAHVLDIWASRGSARPSDGEDANQNRRSSHP